jgi:hypothetical protein
MKKTAIVLSVIFLLSACSSTKELSSNRAENRKLKKLAEQSEVRKAVESRRYVIKVNRLYTMGGGIMDMVASSNFIIVNGEITSISLGYIGRSYSIRPISGINLNGHTLEYKMKTDESKGSYNIQMAVQAGSDKFDVYMTIGDSGNCTISLTNPHIQSVSYSGTLVPLTDTQKIVPERVNAM